MASAGSGKDNPNYRHGGRHTRLYRIWAAMKTRCNNENFWAYKDYGGRGIQVCQSWQSFVPFRKWSMSNGYRNDLTIDRKNNDGNYCPRNCKWSTRKEQANNRRELRSNNTSGYKGVTFSKQHNNRSWRAQVGAQYIGMFPTAYEAHKSIRKFLCFGTKPQAIEGNLGKSGFRGVSYIKRNTNNPWSAQLKNKTGKRIWLGAFNTPEAANKAVQQFLKDQS